MKDKFRILANKISILTGSAYVFSGAVLVVIIWALTGPASNYSETWQLVINTGTTIITFLMVFLIQNTQNRDGRAVQLKLDELIRAQRNARDDFVGLEDITDEELGQLTEQFREMHEKAAPTPAMHKLHQKLEQEHSKRLSLKTAAGQVTGAMRYPFSGLTGSHKNIEKTKKI
ncbi:MAG TPA: low affinity iron permease family protein [Candidatus Saccharimonadales bacterium]|nr:low affinity iron permease family protein [Candidatus Saccharimonadales bacterium]